jgi:hypothetical protein
MNIYKEIGSLLGYELIICSKLTVSHFYIWRALHFHGNFSPMFVVTICFGESDMYASPNSATFEFVTLDMSFFLKLWISHMYSKEYRAL